MQAIGQCCSQLQSVNLGWCENVTDVGVMSLAHGCPDLRTLDLCGCVLITGTSLNSINKFIFCKYSIIDVFDLVKYIRLIRDIFSETLSMRFEALEFYHANKSNCPVIAFCCS